MISLAGGLRAAWRVPLVLGVLLGAAVALLVSVGRDNCGRVVAHHTSKVLLRVLGVRTAVAGGGHRAMPGARTLVVANHISWLDVLVLAAREPMQFIAKREVRRWPLIGALAAGAGTCFVNRDSARQCRDSLPAVQAHLRTAPVVLFAEGTTTVGDGVLPYRPLFIEAAVRGFVPVQPVVLRYTLPTGEPSRAAAFVGDDSFVGSLLRLAAQPATRAELTWRPALPSTCRKHLAHRAEAAAWAVLGAPRPRSVSAPAPPADAGPALSAPRAGSA